MRRRPSACGSTQKRAPRSRTAPGFQVTVTYDPDGTGAKTFTQTFSQFNMGQDAGYVEYRSQQAGGVIATGAGVVSPPLNLTNGSVTISIKAVSNISATAPVRFRTDAAAQQGRVSYIDLPYAFTTVGTSGGNPVPVSKLSLGGQTLGPALPNLNG